MSGVAVSYLRGKPVCVWMDGNNEECRVPLRRMPGTKNSYEFCDESKPIKIFIGITKGVMKITFGTPDKNGKIIDSSAIFVAEEREKQKYLTGTIECKRLM